MNVRKYQQDQHCSSFYLSGFNVMADQIFWLQCSDTDVRVTGSYWPIISAMTCWLSSELCSLLPTFNEEPADRTWSDLPVRGIFDLPLLQVIILETHTKGKSWHIRASYCFLYTDHANMNTWRALDLFSGPSMTTMLFHFTTIFSESVMNFITRSPRVTCKCP